VVEDEANLHKRVPPGLVLTRPGSGTLNAAVRPLPVFPLPVQHQRHSRGHRKLPRRLLTCGTVQRFLWRHGQLSTRPWLAIFMNPALERTRPSLFSLPGYRTVPGPKEARMSRECDVCGREYTARRSSSRFCGGTCAKRSQRAGPAVMRARAAVLTGGEAPLSGLEQAVARELEQAGTMQSLRGQIVRTHCPRAGLPDRVASRVGVGHGGAGEGTARDDDQGAGRGRSRCRPARRNPRPQGPETVGSRLTAVGGAQGSSARWQPSADPKIAEPSSPCACPPSPPGAAAPSFSTTLNTPTPDVPGWGCSSLKGPAQGAVWPPTTATGQRQAEGNARSEATEVQILVSSGSAPQPSQR